jgi:transposase
MSKEYRHVELLTGDVRRRRWTTEQKLTIIEQSFEPGETVSSAARRHGVAPNLLYRWRRLLSEGGAAAVDSDEPVVGNSEVKKLEDTRTPHTIVHLSDNGSAYTARTRGYLPRHSI